MKVVFCIPALTGSLQMRCHQSLVATYRILNTAQIPYEEFVIENCPYLPTARNTLVAMFLADPEATDLFFIDSDVGFDASGVVKILERPEGVVAGIYPLKRELIGYPVQVKTIDNIPIGREGLIEANFLPTGFMRVKRIVFEKMAEAYPELKYADSVVEVMGSGITEAYDFFHMGIDPGRQRWTTEDYAFCQRWRDLGGQLWVYPNINFTHVGSKSYLGNYHEFLLQAPGGLASRWNLERATKIPGWMTLEECIWLAEQAFRHKQIVEIGCCYGRSTRAMADNTEGIVFAVDDWKGPREPLFKPAPGIDIYQEFCSNLKEHLGSKVFPVTADHGQAAQWSTLPAAPDMIFIDGAHDFASVSRDIRIWKERLAPGGLLGGHDYNWEGVRKALDELLPEAQTIPGTNIWCWYAPLMEEGNEQVSLHDGVA